MSMPLQPEMPGSSIRFASPFRRTLIPAPTGIMPEYWETSRSGATLVTANARLARDLRRAYDVRCRDGGSVSWAVADILDWNGWLKRTWNDAVQRGVAPPSVLLSSAQEQLIWEQIIERTPEGRGLLHIPATAEAASEAYALASAWRADLSESDCYGYEDAAAFVRWVRAFEDVLESGGWMSESQLSGELSSVIRERRLSAPEVLLHAGFHELTTAQQRLLDALAAAGCCVEPLLAPAREAPRRFRVGVADASAEVEAAARWARDELETSPGVRVGVVIPDLPGRIAAVERVFEDTFHPSYETVPPSGRRAYHISAGEPLSDAPVVAAAFQALELGPLTISISQAGVLLRSPFLAGGEVERGRRALLDAELRRRGITEMNLATLARLASARDGNGGARAYACPVFARSLRAWRRGMERLSAPQLPSAWSRLFSRLLALSGWPGSRTLDSAEYQAIESWNRLLSQFAALNLVASPLSYSEALARLRRLAAQTRFGPADEHAPVQILGVLEAAGATFDHLWIAGLEDRAWPSSPQPSPFLPPPLQRRLGLPHSSAARELAYARKTLERLLESAPDVVVSWPRREGDTDLRPSPLILELPEASPPTPIDSLSAMQRSGGTSLEELEERAGPALPPGAVTRGGTAIVEHQAACPFGAFAQFRLDARPLEEPAQGFSPLERGTIVHAALDHVWREIRTRDALVAFTPDQRADIVGRAVAAAIESKVRGRGVASAERLIALEQRRLVRLLDRWLDIEAMRGPFTVNEREEPRRIEAGGLVAEVRVDRVDELPDGRRIIIDYKTSISRPGDWEGDRPDAPQLPLYAAKHDGVIAAVLFAQLAPGKLRFKGLGENAGVPECTEYSRSKPGKAAGDSLAGHIAAWKSALDALGAEFCAGSAAVSPKGPDKCRVCGLPALCRIADLGVGIEEGSETAEESTGEER
jgi:probable DNA repair protein